MTRWLYILLLRLHPRAFKQRFGDEMLAIFDQSGERGSLMADGFLSLARQWTLRQPSFAFSPTTAPDGVPLFYSAEAEIPRFSALMPGALVALLVFVAFGWRRRRRAARAAARDTAAYGTDHDTDGGYELAPNGRWAPDDPELADEHLPFGDVHPAESQLPHDAASAARIGWSRGGADDVAPADSGPEDEDPDTVDTTTFPVVSEHDLAEADGAQDDIYPDEDSADGDYPADAYADEDIPDVAVPRTPQDAGYAERADVGYRDLAVPQTSTDQDVFVSDSDATTGRHAALERENAEELANAGPRPTRRPTIHPPLDDPYQAPDGYPIKASARFGLYYTPNSALYDDTIAEFWLSSEEVAQANGFIKAD